MFDLYKLTQSLFPEKGFHGGMVGLVRIAPVSKVDFGSIQIPCMSIQAPTFERDPGQEVFCAKCSVVTSLGFLSLVVMLRLEPRALHMLPLNSEQPQP